MNIVAVRSVFNSEGVNKNTIFVEKITMEYFVGGAPVRRRTREDFRFFYGERLVFFREVQYVNFGGAPSFGVWGIIP